MSTLLIKNISQLVTCDDKDQVLQNVDILCKDGFVEKIGASLNAAADRTIDGSHMLSGSPPVASLHSRSWSSLIFNSSRISSFNCQTS